MDNVRAVLERWARPAEQDVPPSPDGGWGPHPPHDPLADTHVPPLPQPPGPGAVPGQGPPPPPPGHGTGAAPEFPLLQEPPAPPVEPLNFLIHADGVRTT